MMGSKAAMGRKRAVTMERHGGDVERAVGNKSAWGVTGLRERRGNFETLVKCVP